MQGLCQSDDARHRAAGPAVIQFKAINDLRSHRITLILRDKDPGFQPDASTDGNGHCGMRHRASAADVTLHSRCLAATAVQRQIGVPDPRFTHSAQSGIEGKP